jgi:hypothetical protein
LPKPRRGLRKSIEQARALAEESERLIQRHRRAPGD